MELIRPSGLIERLGRGERADPAPEGYGRSQPGPNDREALEIGARQDRRGRRRRRSEPYRGRLLDLQT